MRVIIAAAGTAGHINPGISIANKIKENYSDAEIIFIGTTRGIENDLVPKAGYKLKTIDAYGLSKKISIDNFKKMYKTIQGFSQSKKIIKEFNPDIVIGTGGYICGAVISEAHKLKIPTMLHESNAFPGKAVKILAKKTDTIAVSFKEAIDRIKKCKNIVHTGTPVKLKKYDFTEAQKQEILGEFGLKIDKPTILVFGGSQGARNINNAILNILEKEINNNYQIIWSVGMKLYDEVKEQLETKHLSINNTQNIKIVPYIYNMEDVMNSIDIVVSRSGAMTISEISNLGKPSILIPLPNVSHDHQLYNAKVLKDLGAAEIILDKDLTAEKLDEEINKIIKNKMTVIDMGKNALKNSILDADDRIYAEILKLLKK